MLEKQYGCVSKFCNVWMHKVRTWVHTEGGRLFFTWIQVTVFQTFILSKQPNVKIIAKRIKIYTFPPIITYYQIKIVFQKFHSEFSYLNIATTQTFELSLQSIKTYLILLHINPYDKCKGCIPKI